ncbi:response regulator transcription factor [Photobacterium sp. GSS17]|uniref:response regulator transcription factor n=1 Tax=Photobacterium TaxID=657 RepID=UPI0023600FB5|nr:response regulator transcription factor [Photobacterium sp. GSS17]
MLKLLIIDQSHCLQKRIHSKLVEMGLLVHIAQNHHDGLKMLLSEHYDLIILDYDKNNPEHQGFISSIRKLELSVRLLALTTEYTPEVIVSTLTSGADDIIAKPVSFDELYARIQSLFRRRESHMDDALILIDECMLNKSEKCLYCQGDVIKLTKTEFLIIEFLFTDHGKLKSVEQIKAHLTNEGISISKNSIEAHLSTVRRKLKQVNRTLPISNRRGLGYVAG